MHEAKSNLSKLVAKACNGEVVEIGPSGGAAVRLVPVKKNAFPWGCMKAHGELSVDWNSDETNAEIARRFHDE